MVNQGVKERTARVVWKAKNRNCSKDRLPVKCRIGMGLQKGTCSHHIKSRSKV